MRPYQVISLTSLAMIAFAGNSVLCRIALKDTSIDAMSFTFVRLFSGALILGIWLFLKQGKFFVGGNWYAALALFVYATCFSFAYIDLATATGALILFSAVQATMMTDAISSGERLNKQQITGLIIALIGLVVLLLPGISAPSLGGSILMLLSGISWGVYSVLGKHTKNATNATAGNFIRTLPIAGLCYLISISINNNEFDTEGVLLAIASGALASGLGYAIWYSVLPAIKASSASSIQLSVPVIAAFGGVIFLGEAVSLRLGIASVAILGGIALVILTKKPFSASSDL